MTDCKCKDSTGWTTVKCCNLCGKSVEEFWKADDAKDKEIQSLTEQLQKANELLKEYDKSDHIDLDKFSDLEKQFS